MKKKKNKKKEIIIERIIKNFKKINKLKDLKKKILPKYLVK